MILFIILYITVTILISLININYSNHIIKYNIYYYFSRKRGGPSSLSKSIRRSLNLKNIYKRDNVKIIFHILNDIKDNTIKEILNNKSNLIWIQDESLIKYIVKRNKRMNIILGPNVLPMDWFKLPKKWTYEEKWNIIMSRILAYAAQTNRSKNHIINKTNTELYRNKYILIPPCFQLERSINENDILPFDKRNNDYLIYLKYADLNRRKEGELLINELKRNNKIIIIEYGYYNYEEMINYSKISKYLIYFSFYDVGPSALIEMQEYGIFVYSHQKEFINEINGYFLKELDLNITQAISIILNNKIKYNPLKISKNTQRQQNCINSIQKSVNSIVELIK